MPIQASTRGIVVVPVVSGLILAVSTDDPRGFGFAAKSLCG